MLKVELLGLKHVTYKLLEASAQVHDLEDMH